MKYLHVLRLVPPYRAVSYRKDERTGQGSHSCHHILYETALGCTACASAGGMHDYWQHAVQQAAAGPFSCPRRRQRKSHAWILGSGAEPSSTNWPPRSSARQAACLIRCKPADTYITSQDFLSREAKEPRGAKGTKTLCIIAAMQQTA